MTKGDTLARPVQVAHTELPAYREKASAVVDETERNLLELFLLRNPRFRFDRNYQSAFEEFAKPYRKEAFGSWFFFPWSGDLVRYFPEDLHLELRTGRNKYLIRGDEQYCFYYSTSVFLGMSVGSHVAVVLAMTGGSRHVRLADPDILSGDNLNRIRLGFSSVGLPKAVLVARQIYEINPYADVELFPEGINEENAARLLEGADVVIEEMDNPFWKFRARELARQRGIPVLMGTDNGDGVIADIERFDLNRLVPLFNGLVGSMTADSLRTLDPKDIPRTVGKIAGADLVVPRMLDSVLEVGRSLYSWPQLGTAANMCGSIIAYLARRVILGDTRIRSGRFAVNPDAIFEHGYLRRTPGRKLAFVRFIREMSKRV